MKKSTMADGVSSRSVRTASAPSKAVAPKQQRDQEGDRRGGERESAQDADEAPHRSLDSCELIYRDREPRHGGKLARRLLVRGVCGDERRGADPVSSLTPQAAPRARVLREAG